MLIRKFSLALALGGLVALNGLTLAAEPKAKPTDVKSADAKTTEAKTGEKSAEPTKPAETSAASLIKLPKPWSELMLTDEQKVKIEAIHKKALAEVNVIEKKEKEDITGMLTDQQKAELKELTSKKRKEATAKKVEAPEKKPAEATEKK